MSVQRESVNQSVMSEIQDFFASSNFNQSHQETLSSLRSTYERVEQHQLDMEFLRQQFEKLNQPTGLAASRLNQTDFQSPWPNPPSLHFSSFGGEPGGAAAASANNDKPLFQKTTQTETSLFEDPFKTSIQQYSLFGGDGTGEADVDNPHGDFSFNPVLEPTSPGVVGDRTTHHPHHEHMQRELGDEETLEMFPYRLRISEYNPLSYQGEIAIQKCVF